MLSPVQGSWSKTPGSVQTQSLASRARDQTRQDNFDSPGRRLCHPRPVQPSNFFKELIVLLFMLFFFPCSKSRVI